MAHRDRLGARPKSDADAPPYRGRPWLAEIERDPEPPPPPPPPPPKKSRRGAIVGSLVAALTAGAVVAAVLLFLGHDDKNTAKPLAAAAGGGSALTAPAVYASASPGVVSIAAREGRGTSTGTGFLIDKNGTVVTNAHVVGSAGTAQVRFGDPGRTIDAPIPGPDASSDLAVLHVDPADAGVLHPLALADSGKVRIGDAAIA